MKHERGCGVCKVYLCLVWCHHDRNYHYHQGDRTQSHDGGLQNCSSERKMPHTRRLIISIRLSSIALSVETKSQINGHCCHFGATSPLSLAETSQHIQKKHRWWLSQSELLKVRLRYHRCAAVAKRWELEGSRDAGKMQQRQTAEWVISKTAHTLWVL